MSAIDDWKRIPFFARDRIANALRSRTVLNALAEVLDPPNTCNELNGPEMTHEEERDIDTALRVLEEP